MWSQLNHFLFLNGGQDGDHAFKTAGFRPLLHPSQTDGILRLPGGEMHAEEGEEERDDDDRSNQHDEREERGVVDLPAQSEVHIVDLQEDVVRKEAAPFTP